MTNVGDTGHVSHGHNDLADAVNTELARFGLVPALVHHKIGDPNHVGVHGLLVLALSDLATAAGKTYTAPLPAAPSLGDSGHVTDHDTLWAAVTEAATWPAWNDATGGTITEVDNYNGTGETWRVHAWPTAGGFAHALSISVGAQPFRVLVVGGGGNPSTSGGGGGEVIDTTVSLAATTHDIVVGGAAAQSYISQGANVIASARGGHNGNGGSTFVSGGASGNGNPGGGSSADGWWPGGGGGAGGPGGSGEGKPAARGPGVWSNITGASVEYGYGGVRYDAAGLSGVAAPGGVIVAYRIG